jgi:hypothetical protein
MPPVNVEIVRGILRTWERGDFRTAADLFAPDVRFETFMPDATDNLFAHGFAEVKVFTRDPVMPRLRTWTHGPFLCTWLLVDDQTNTLRHARVAPMRKPTRQASRGKTALPVMLGTMGEDHRASR